MASNDFLYNALPYLYTAGGATTLVTTQELIGNISGLLLISAAMLVFHMRLEHRTRRAEVLEENLSMKNMCFAPAHPSRHP